jgi:hypothetical protein
VLAQLFQGRKKCTGNKRQLDTRECCCLHTAAAKLTLRFLKAAEFISCSSLIPEFARASFVRILMGGYPAVTGMLIRRNRGEVVIEWIEVSVAATSAKWLLLTYVPVRLHPVPFGVVLFIPSEDRLVFQCREDTGFINPRDLDVLSGTSAMFASLLAELGARRTFEWMESSLSNTVRVEGPFEISTTDPVAELDMLYRRHVEST